jgi:acetoacetate decarboxylase
VNSYDSSSHIAWCDPPWLITGRSITGWFPVPRTVLEASVPPRLRREGGDDWARLRFYDARFQACGASEEAHLAPRAGAFREAVVAFAAVAGELEGDGTMFMWADDEAYTTWGREVFGWPILRGGFTFEGTIWDSPLAAGARGSAMLRASAGTAAIGDVRLGEQIDSSTSGGWWITPWRRLERAALDGERTDVVAARPRIVRPGRTYDATGAIRLEFAPGHPLHGLVPQADRVVVVDGFELIVGGDVEIVDPSATAPD